jgi:hypothetical protein
MGSLEKIYVDFDCVSDPAPQLAALRELRRVKPETAFEIVLKREPVGDAERSYLLFFEEFHPVRNGIASSPPSTVAAAPFEMAQLDIPTEPFLPVTGEFLQSLCDYTVVNARKKKEIHDWITVAAPIDRQLMTEWVDLATPLDRQVFTEVEWPANVIATAKSLFVYPDTDLLKAVIDRGPWPALRLIVIHNGDDPVNYELLLPFLEANLTIYAWVQNNVVTHPRIRSIPIAEQNRMWREGTAEVDPPITVCRSSSREYGILYPWCSDTHHSRREWYQQARELRGRLRDMHLFTAPHPKDDYIEALESAHAVVCPRGNGLDTHRHWESLYKGAWAIVPANAHTTCMLREYPSLPLIPIEGPSDLATLTLPPVSPSPFHPMLLRPFWQTLFRSYIEA